MITQHEAIVAIARIVLRQRGWPHDQCSIETAVVLAACIVGEITNGQETAAVKELLLVRARQRAYADDPHNGTE
jgi:hypothetical protein